MQVQKKKALGKRSRYYHSQMVMESLESGEDYESLPDTYVILIHLDMVYTVIRLEMNVKKVKQ